MQEISESVVDEMVERMKERGESVHPLWFFSTEGTALWSQSHMVFPLISGMIVSPPGLGSHRIVTMEDHAKHGITVIRVDDSADDSKPNLGDDPRFYSPVYQPGLRSDYPDPEGDRELELLFGDQLDTESDVAEQTESGGASWWRKFFPFF